MRVKWLIAIVIGLSWTALAFLPVSRLSVTVEGKAMPPQTASALSVVKVPPMAASGVLTPMIYLPLIVRRLPINFVGEPLSGCAPLTVDFTNLTPETGVLRESLWDFGDGTGSTQHNPIHTYTTPGNYTVTLSVKTNEGSGVLTRPDYITVASCDRALQARFALEPMFGAAPLTVYFTNTSTGPYTASLWDFGDGATSVEQHPVHTYTLTGTFTVSLTVSNDITTSVPYVCGSCVTVGITSTPVLTANFTATPLSGAAPLAVKFTNTSQGPYTASLWNFGDGHTSTATNLTYTYTLPNTYTVMLTVSNTTTSDTVTRTSYITVSPTCTVKAVFTANPISGYVPLTVSFQNQSIGLYTSSQWNFGDGSPLATTLHPTHVYTVPGVYTPTLTVSNASCSDTLLRTNYITATPPIADFNASPRYGAASLTVVFTNTSQGPYTHSRWNFGDGTLTTTQHATHIYTSGGMFTVTLAVSNAFASSTVTRTNYIATLKANFSHSPSSGYAPLTVYFTNTSESLYTSSWWDFGDGYTATTQHATHTYTQPGPYTVSLTVTNGVISSTTTCKNCVTIGPCTPNGAVCNGGFENEGYWEIPITEYPARITTERPHTGARSLLAGIVDWFDNRYSYSSGRQVVFIPANAVTATLRFWLYPLSTEWLALARAPEPLKTTRAQSTWYGDAQYVLILDPYTELEIGRLVDQRSNANAWVPYEFDLAPYAGQWIKLYFGVYNNGWDGYTAMYVDDVSLTVTIGSGQATARPLPRDR